MDKPKLGDVVRGVLAGAVGTLAMDLLWYRRFKADGGDGSFTDWEFSTGSVDSFDDAGTPAKVGQLAAKAVGKVIPDDRAGLTTDVVHWATGSQWGATYAAATAALGSANPALGLALGPAAWGTAYVVLPLAGIYEPIWKYDAETLAKDFSAHLVFGLGTGAAYWLIRRR